MKWMTALLAGVILTMGTTTAQALTLTLTSGGETVVIEDGSARDFNPTLSNIFFQGAVNGISVTSATGSGHFDPTRGTFDIGSYIFSGSGTITILLTQTGLALNTAPLDPNLYVVQSLSSSNNSGNAVVTGDVRIDGVTVPGIATTLTGTSAAVSDGVATVGDLFTLEQLVHIDLGAGSTVNVGSTVDVAPVPEPGTLVLLGAGFLGLAIYGKRRKNV